MDVLNFGSDAADELRVNPEVLFAHQDFAAELQQNSFVFCFQITGLTLLERPPRGPFGAFRALHRS